MLVGSKAAGELVCVVHLPVKRRINQHLSLAARFLRHALASPGCDGVHDVPMAIAQTSKAQSTSKRRTGLTICSLP